MEKVFNINNKEIKNIDTTILHTSTYNYNADIVELISNNFEVITKNDPIIINEISAKNLSNYDSLDLINKKDLTFIDEIKIRVLNSLNSNKDIIVFYDILNYLDISTKRKIIKELQEKGKRIINYTTEIEESLLLDYLIIVHNSEVIMEGNTIDVLRVEKILKKLGFNMPLIVELSNGLKYYECVNRTYYDIESLVNDLWK